MAKFPKNIRLTEEMEEAFEQIGLSQVPPVDFDQRGAFVDLLRRLTLWARDLMLHRIHVCPDDLAPMEKTETGFKCPKCGGIWQRGT